MPDLSQCSFRFVEFLLHNTLLHQGENANTDAGEGRAKFEFELVHLYSVM